MRAPDNRWAIHGHPTIRNKRSGRISLHARPLMERVGRADALNGYLLIIEIILSGELQRFAKRVADAIREEGLYRQQVKRQTNLLAEQVNDLQKRCMIADAEVMLSRVFEIMPSYSRAYIGEGGGVAVRFQTAFSKISSDVTQRTFICNKQLLDRCSAPHSLIMANLLTLQQIAEVGVCAYDAIATQQDALLFGDVVVHRNKYRHHEAVIHQAACLLDAMGGVPSYEGCSKELGDRDALLKQMIDYLSGEKFEHLVNISFRTVLMEYTEFVLASICMDLHGGTLPDGVIDAVRTRLGSEEQALQLMNELRAVHVPDGVEAWDFAEEIPEGGVGSAIAAFRHLCVERPDLPDAPSGLMKINS